MWTFVQDGYKNFLWIFQSRKDIGKEYEPNYFLVYCDRFGQETESIEKHMIELDALRLMERK